MTHEPHSEVSCEIRPCRHMEQWVNALADDSLTGPMRWYVKFHAWHCAQCRTALTALKRLRANLQALHASKSARMPTTLPPDRRQALKTAMDDMERAPDHRPHEPHENV